MNALELFKAEWMELSLAEIHTTEPTCSPTGRRALPPIPPADPSFAWLPKVHPEVEDAMVEYRPQASAREEYRRRRKALLQEASLAGITLPESFLTLSGSFELQDRIPSATACYFDLPDHLMASPFRDGDYILRFLNDQQDCVCWYLYIPPDAETFVISFTGYGQEPYLDQIDFEGSPDSMLVAKNDTAVVAKSFDEFIYRFWISNVIWFHLDMKLPLSTAALAYIRHLDANYADPNAA